MHTQHNNIIHFLQNLQITFLLIGAPSFILLPIWNSGNKKDGWTVRSEYIHSTGKAFAKSITNFNDANAKDCNLNANIGDKAQGVYGLVIAPLAQLPKNSRIDVKARYDMYQPNGKSNMQRTQYEAGLNFHIGKRISILTEYALINDKTLAKHNYSMADAEVCFRF